MELESFFVYGLPRDPLLMQQHDFWLVTLSVLVSVVASILAMHMVGFAGQMKRNSTRHALLASGAVSLGCGIWAMHFIGMLAFPLCAQGDFDIALTLASMVPSLAASWVALTLLTRPQWSAKTLVLGGVLVGLGIGAMHYSGMAAAQLAPLLRYDPWGFLASIGVAVLLACLALWVRFGLQAQALQRPVLVTVVAGVVMGLAIAGMHYTGMSALRLATLDPSEVLGDSHQGGALALGIAAIAVLVAALVTITGVGLRFQQLYRKSQYGESRLRAMLDTAVEGIIVIDSHGLVQLYNDAAERLLGWTAAEMVGHNVNRLMPEPHGAQHDSYIAQYLSTGVSSVVGARREVSALHKDGHVVPIFLAVGQVQHPGEPLFVAFLTDLTQRHTMLREKQRLRDARDEAQALAAARSAFLANMSHEIRTPMNAIIGFTEAVLDTPLDTSQRRHLGTVQKSAHSLLRLLNDILDTAKLDKGAVTLESADFSLRDLCTQVLASLQINAHKKNLALSLDCAPDVPEFLQGDALRLQQILLNLVGNAIKFTERGGVTVRVAYADGTLAVQVVDTGIGIDADSLERIFAPFSQADASTTRRFGGTGLGTTIALQLAKLMGGTIGVQSTVGQGSTFTLRVPLAQGQPVVMPSREFLAQLPVLRVLAVDDVSHNLELLQICLAPGKHQVTLAVDGEEALALFKQGTFDMVLMDLQMPVMDGLDCTRHIRAFEQAHQRSPVPIVALTASVLEQDRQGARDAGMDGFAVKPLEPLRLFAEMARVLGLEPAFPVDAQPGPEASPSPAPQQYTIDWERGLRLWTVQGALRTQIERFLADIPSAVQDMNDALALPDWPALIALAHRLRGAAGNLALDEVRALLSDLEAAAKAREWAAARASLDTLPLALAAVRQVLAETMVPATSLQNTRSDTSTKAQHPDRLNAGQAADVRHAMAQLAAALAEGELAEAPLQMLDGLLDESVLAPLLAAINDFDFDAAQASLKILQAHWAADAPSPPYEQP